jgi:hypothetical protein
LIRIQSGYGFRRAKMTYKKKKKVKKINVWKCWMFSFEDWRLFLLIWRPLWSHRESKNCNFWYLKKIFFFSRQLLVIKTLDPHLDPEPHRYSAKMLDPDPNSMNPKTQHWKIMARTILTKPTNCSWGLLDWMTE